jgi:DNA-binding LytR/AlgR family response regulator
MLYIDICSDSVNELEHLYSLVKSYQKNHIQVGVRVRRFHSFYDLILRMREEGSAQLYLLDCRGGESWMEGLSAEAFLRRMDPQGITVSLTSPAEHPPGLTFYVDQEQRRGFLCKPVSSGVLDYLLDWLADKGLLTDCAPQELLHISTHSGTIPLHPANIACIRYNEHIFFYHTTGGKTIQSNSTNTSFTEMVRPLLQAGRGYPFQLISPACLVNLDYVVSMDSVAATVTMRDGTTLSATRKKWASAAAAWEARLASSPFFATESPGEV